MVRAAPYMAGRGRIVACTPFFRVYMPDVVASVEQGIATAIPCSKAAISR